MSRRLYGKATTPKLLNQPERCLGLRAALSRAIKPSLSWDRPADTPRTSAREGAPANSGSRGVANETSTAKIGLGCPQCRAKASSPR